MFDARIGLKALAAIAIVAAARDALPGDPLENHSGFLGGSAVDRANGCASDGAGNTYVAGTTSSAGFGGAGSSGDDAFLSKIGPAGEVLWTARIGGSSDDRGLGVAVAPGGSVLLAGETASANFPTTTMTGAGGSFDAFVAVYSSSGVLQRTHCFGGPGEDSADGVSAGADGRVHVAGRAGTGFPTVSPVATPPAAGGFDAWYARLSADGANETVTLLAGPGDDRAFAVAAGGDGLAAVGGITASSNFMGSASPGAAGGNNTDGFVALFERGAAATTLRFVRSIGGNGYDFVRAVAVDGATVLAAGSTDTSGLTSAGAFQRGLAAGDAFVARFDATGARQWLTYLGGSGTDEAFAVGTIGGDVAVAGVTRPAPFTDVFPVNEGAFQPDRGGASDAFLARLSADGTSLVGGTLFGGASDDDARGLAPAGLDSLALAGGTASPGLFAAGGGDLSFGGSTDGFAARICPVRGIAVASDVLAEVVTVPERNPDVRIAWTPAVGAAQQVIRRRSFEDGGAPITTLATLDGSTGAYTDVQPTRLTGEYWVETIDAAGRSTWSRGARAAGGSGGVASPPEAPDMLDLETDGSRIDVRWRDNSDDEDAFVVQRAIDGGPFVEVARTGPGEERARIPQDAAVGSVVAIQVVAVNAAGPSAPAGPLAYIVTKSFGFRLLHGFADNGSNDARLLARGRFLFDETRTFDPAREPFLLRFACAVLFAIEAEVAIPAGDLGWRARGRRLEWASSRSALEGRPRGRVVLDRRSRRFAIDLRGADVPDFSDLGYPLVPLALELTLGDDFGASTDEWRFTGRARRALRFR
ncbi:MAG: hypothetical protein HMLKMBBP_00043 [Planctomycetes bacterium]|nr:hypothetical protein [Planctomycetota bacterium]